MYLIRFLIMLFVIIAEQPKKVSYMTEHMNTRHLDIEIRDVKGFTQHFGVWSMEYGPWLFIHTNRFLDKD